LLDEYLSSGIQPGEEALPDEPEQTPQFVPNEAAMAQLEAMGFPKPRCEKALYNTGNTDADTAMNWLFCHMEDPDIDEPLVIPTASNTTASSVNEENIDTITSMGFSRKKAKRALIATNGNVESAMEWIFGQMDAPEEDDNDEEVEQILESSKKEVQAGSLDLPANFKLNSIVCHKGGSIHAGHYVAFVKKDLNNVEGEEGEHWVLFNDEKVVKSGDAEEMKKFAYVLSF
jgi:ubiquitin carboxyl-terminal hydrolase 5/13